MIWESTGWRQKLTIIDSSGTSALSVFANSVPFRSCTQNSTFVMAVSSSRQLFTIWAEIMS